MPDLTPTRPNLLVTGGSRGIGAVICKLAATQGFDVAVNYKHDADAAVKMAAEVPRSGARALVVQGDMSSEAEVAR